MPAQPGFDPAGRATDLPRLCRELSERSPLAMVAVEGTDHVVSYLNPAFARLVGRQREDLIGRRFAEAVPEGERNGCLPLLDRVLRTGVPEDLAEQEHGPSPRAFWSYAAWAIFGEDERPVGVMIHVSDSTETATFRGQVTAMNEALLLSSVRQHQLTAEAEALNERLREARDRLDERVAGRTAQLAQANEALSAEIAAREAAEEGRRDLLRRLATAQEDERRRIARELHDHMGQLLAAVGLGLKALENATPDPSTGRPHLSRLRELIDTLGKEVHDLALELRPTALDDLGLRAALAAYAGQWSARSGIEVDLQVAGPDADRLPAPVETALYRVVQEALTNVVKHAQARHVSLVLHRSPGEAVAVVEDDGRGFEPDEVPAGEHLGLLGMRERLALVGGTLTIESTLGRGATVIARVPLGPSQGGSHG